MTFEFVIVYQRGEDTRIREILSERLGTVLTDNLNEFEEQMLRSMIAVNFERTSEPAENASDNETKRAVLAFTLELPDESASPRIVIDEFYDALSGAQAV